MTKLGSEGNNEIIKLVDPDLLDFKIAMNKSELWLLEGAKLGEKRCLFFYYAGQAGQVFQQNWTQAALNHAVNFKFDM